MNIAQAEGASQNVNDEFSDNTCMKDLFIQFGIQNEREERKGKMPFYSYRATLKYHYPSTIDDGKYLLMTEVNISNKSYYQIKFNEIEFLNNFKPNSNEEKSKVTEAHLQRMKTYNIMKEYNETLKNLSFKNCFEHNPFNHKLTQDYLNYLQIPHYTREITNPIDLITISENIEKDTYTLDSYHGDLLLLIKNAKQFNKPKDPIHIAALELEKVKLITFARI